MSDTDHNSTQFFPSSQLAKVAVPPSRLSWDALPETWGDYDQVQSVAQGAMGMVYRGRHRSLQRWEAIKVMRADAEAQPAELERFRFEAEAAGRLDHPNIVPIYRVGVVEELPYLAMKWIEGGTLAARLERFRDQPTAIATLMAKLARAIQHAHEHGILHRDLKPSNIILDQNDEPHIADFGLARQVDNPDQGLTQTGSVLGTPRYMSPEQAKCSKHITTSTDIYSLGAVLYEVLTGQAPFVSDWLFELLEKIGNEVPKLPSSLNPNVHRDLQVICMKCLEKEPRDRYSSARELAEDLERVVRGENILIRPPGLKDWIVRELTKVPPPFTGYVIGVKYWFAGLMMAGQLAIFETCRQGGTVAAIWLIYVLAWSGCTLALWWYMAARFTRLPQTEQHSVMVAVGHLVTHIVYNLGCLPWTGPADQVLPLYPGYTMISGLALFVIGTTHWGRFYWYGLAVMALLPVVMLFPNSAPLIYGTPVAASMLSWALMLRRLMRDLPKSS